MTETTKKATVKQVRSLPWVSYLGEIRGPHAREDATHRLESPLSELRPDREIHTLQNLGVSISAFSATPDKGSRLYVTV